MILFKSEIRIYYFLKVTLSCCLLGCFFQCIKAQQLPPSVLPEQFNQNNTLKIDCYCKPGLENKSPSRGLVFNYGRVFGGSMTNQNTGNIVDLEGLSNWTFKLKVPLINKERSKLIAGYRLEKENYLLGNVESDPFFEFAQSYFFRKNALSLAFIHALNKKAYLGFTSNLQWNGNYSTFFSFKEQFRHYNLVGVYGYKKNKDTELGLGLLYSHGLRSNTRILPFAFYNKNWSPRWGIELVLPVSINLRYNLVGDKKNRTILLAGIQYRSASFALENNSLPESWHSDLIYTHADFEFEISLERRLSKWFWGEIVTGYQYNFTSTLFDLNTQTSTNLINLSNAPFFRLGFFVSPPEDFLK